MKLKEALGIGEKEVIALVGGGGKTTLMFALAKELSDGEGHVITTTTTKIFEPSATDTEKLVLSWNREALLTEITRQLPGFRHITAARERMESGKLIGIEPGTVVALAALPPVSQVIVEADGAARHSLKAPADYEPVIPPNTSLVIAVAGLEFLGSRLAEDTVFRSALAAKLLQVPLGTVISPQIIASLIALPGGITKGSPAGARIVPFLNKMDIENGLEKGRQVARLILEMAYPRIKTVLLGRAQDADPVIEVIRYNNIVISYEL